MERTILYLLCLVALASAMSAYPRSQGALVEEDALDQIKSRRLNIAESRYGNHLPTHSNRKKPYKTLTKMEGRTKTEKLISNLFSDKGWNDEVGCNGDVAAYDVESDISSPRHPRDYPNNAYCEYLLEAPAGKAVSLTFVTFDLEHQMDCGWDSLCFYDGEDDYGSYLGCFCGEMDDLVIASQSSSLFVVFHSDDSERRAGFEAEWTFVDAPTTSGGPGYDNSGYDYSGYDYSGYDYDFSPAPPCDQSLSGETGFLSSPRATDGCSYPNNAHCVYTISVPQGKLVHLRFETFDLEFVDFCTYDRVEIHDGAGEHTPMVGEVHCGSFAPSDVTSSGPHLTVIFVTDHSVTGTGFRAHWTAVNDTVYPFPPAPGPGSGSGSGSGPGTGPRPPVVGPPTGAGTCGVPAIQGRSRIVGGIEAVPHSWPWQISLRFHGSHICGGSIISTEWVVTAAHCVGGNPSPSNFKVRVGEHNFNGNEPSQADIEVREIIAHERYNSGTMDSDVAVLRLATPVTFGEKISPVCLAASDAQVGLLCTTTGWGNTEDTGDSDVLRQVNVPIISPNICNGPDMYNGDVTNTMVCAGFPEGEKDSCQGDSGGPLVCRNAAGTHFSLHGITSWGFGCADPNAPGIYSRVSRLNGWIEGKTGVSPRV